MTLENRKYRLIQDIMRVTEESTISKLEQILRDYSSAMDSIQHFVRKKVQMLDLEQLAKEQGYTGLDKERLDRLIDEIEEEDSIEDLLKMI